MMFRIGILIGLFGAVAFAQSFTFMLGSPVAAGDARAKMAAFVFRTQGCAEPVKAEISATAEGLVSGARRSVSLTVVQMSTPGVYAVYQNWPPDGQWVVNLKGACAKTNAGAVVPIGPRGFVRESAKFFPRYATQAEIESALKPLSSGDKGDNK